MNRENASKLWPLMQEVRLYFLWYFLFASPNYTKYFFLKFKQFFSIFRVKDHFL